MDFGDAIKTIKNGHRVKREDWGGFWFIPSWNPKFGEYTKSTFDSNADEVSMNPVIIAKLKDGDGYAPAQPYMADMLADDWIDLDDEEEKSKPKTLEERKKDFYDFLQFLNHDFKINDISKMHNQYTVKIKDKYIRFDFGTHSYYLADTDEYNSFSDSSFLSLNEVIESLKDIFESSNYGFDLDDVTIGIATPKRSVKLR